MTMTTTPRAVDSMPSANLFGIEEATADLVTTEGAAALLGIAITSHESSKICALGAWLDARIARRLCWFEGDLKRYADTGASISPGYHYERAAVEALLLGERFAE